jgi:hypothetical protein
LGYYADGAKRTLTDDQVAIFRHSEIQTCLRERRQRQSKKEEEEEEEQGHGDVEGDRIIEPITAPSSALKDQRLDHRPTTGKADDSSVLHEQEDDHDYGNGMSNDGMTSIKADLPSLRTTNRKVVAYDDLNEVQPELPETTATSPQTSKHNFLWPVLGK